MIQTSQSWAWLACLTLPTFSPHSLSSWPTLVLPCRALRGTSHLLFHLWAPTSSFTRHFLCLLALTIPGKNKSRKDFKTIGKASQERWHLKNEREIIALKEKEWDNLERDPTSQYPQSGQEHHWTEAGGKDARTEFGQGEEAQSPGKWVAFF